MNEKETACYKESCLVVYFDSSLQSARCKRFFYIWPLTFLKLM